MRQHSTSVSVPLAILRCISG